MSQIKEIQETTLTDLIQEPEIIPQFVADIDTTSVNDIQVLMAEDSGQLLGDTNLYARVEDFMERAGSAEEDTAAQVIGEGVDLLSGFFAQYNRSWHGVEGTFTNYAISLGRVLIHLKALVKRHGGQWGEWATRNITFMSERTRETYMKLAGREDAHPYAYLGKERLLLLIAATKGAEGDDPIGQFLNDSGIHLDVERENSLEQFKVEIDAALASARARKQGVEISVPRSKELLEHNVNVDGRLFRELGIIQKSGGNPDVYLNELLLNRGSRPAEDEPRRRIDSLEKLVAQLSTTIDDVIADENITDLINLTVIQSLEDKLAQLKATIERNL